VLVVINLWFDHVNRQTTIRSSWKNHCFGFHCLRECKNSDLNCSKIDRDQKTGCDYPSCLSYQNCCPSCSRGSSYCCAKESTLKVQTS
jgi:hypothetical protein